MLPILITENNPTIRMRHREQLIAWGYDFDLAANEWKLNTHTIGTSASARLRPFFNHKSSE